LFVQDIAYVANLGDSRAVMSLNQGKSYVRLTRDHKPEDPDETQRIESNGGRVYQNINYLPDPTPGQATQTLTGP